MNYLINKISLSLCFACFVLLCSAGVTTITLTSARAVKAEIVEQPSPKSVRIAVQFIPVSSLDALNNERMNSVIARFFIEDALSQFYKKGKTVNFTSLKPVVVETIKQKKRYVYIVPHSEISDIVAKTEKKEKKTVAGYSKFFADDIFLNASELFTRDLKLVEKLKRLQDQLELQRMSLPVLERWKECIKEK